LRLHPIGLSVNVASGLSQEQSLPDHTAHLQESNQRQESCKPFQFPLYGEILAALLASLIASWGGWLWGGGHRIWGSLIAALGLGLCFSVLTTAGFCDPLFWRAEWRSLTGQEANRCDCAEHTEYHHTFQHIVEMYHEYLDLRRMRVRVFGAWPIYQTRKASRVPDYSRPSASSLAGRLVNGSVSLPESPSLLCLLSYFYGSYFADRKRWKYDLRMKRPSDF
jgi:hypothetical protein